MILARARRIGKTQEQGSTHGQEQGTLHVKSHGHMHSRQQQHEAVIPCQVPPTLAASKAASQIRVAKTLANGCAWAKWIAPIPHFASSHPCP